MSTEPRVSVILPAHAPDRAMQAERGYVAILLLLERGALRLSNEVCAAAQAFTANRHLNRRFRHYARSGPCASLEQFLDVTENGRPPWAEAKMARLIAEPGGA